MIVMPGVTLSAALLAGILTAQVAQLGFEARMLSRLSTVETRVEERTTPINPGNGGDD